MSYILLCTLPVAAAYLAPHVICQLGVLGKLLLKVCIGGVLHLELVHHAGLLCLPQGLVTLPAVNIPTQAKSSLKKKGQPLQVNQSCRHMRLMTDSLHVETWLAC